MKKLLSIVLALALVLGMLPAFADTTSTETPGEVLKRYGVIVGGQNGNLNEDGKLSRAELTVIIARMHGKVEEAQNFAAEHPFTDVPADHWAKGFISFAKAQGLMSGTSENTFNPDGNVDNNMLASVLIRALGYDTPADYATSADQLNKLTNISIPSGDIKRADLFNALVPALKDNLMKDGKSLGKDVLKIQAIINEIPAPAALEITEVIADNLKQIFVKFNQPLNKDKLGSFVIKGFELSPVIQEDGMSVVLNAEPALKDQKEYTLVVENTEATAEGVEKLAKTEMKFTPLDKERPIVEKVEFTGPKHVTVTFNEPIQPKKGVIDVMIGKTRFGVDSKTTTNGNQVTLPLFSNLKEDKEYTITVKDFVDFKNLPNIEKDFTLTYNKNTESPEVTISDVTQTSAVFKFSKPVKGLKKDKFHHTLSRYEAVSVGVGVNDEVSEVKVVFYDPTKSNSNEQPIPEGNAKIWIDGDKITDLWGNALGNKEFTVLVEADRTAPEVKEIKVVDEETLLVIFTEDVQKDKNTAKLEKHFIVKSGSDDVLKKAAFRKNAEGDDILTQVVLELADKFGGKELKVEVDKFTDTSVNANKLVPYSDTVTIGDKTPPVIKKVTKDSVKNSKNEVIGGKLYVMFSENMDSASALDVANYSYVKSVDGKDVYTKLTGALDFFNDNSVVVIELTKKEYEALPGARLSVGSLKDIAGNEIVQKMVSSIEDHSTEMAITPAKYEGTNDAIVEAISSREIKVKLNQKIYEARVAEGSTKLITVGSHEIAGVDVDGSDTITIRLKTDNANTNKLDTTGNNIPTDTLTINAGALKGEFTGDGYNAAAVCSSKTIYNKVAPAVKTDANGVMQISVKNGVISVPFTRKLDSSVPVAVLNQYFLVKRDGDLLSSGAGHYGVALKSGDASVVEITLDPTQRKNGEYSVELSNALGHVKADGAANREKVSAKSFTFDFEDVIDVAGPSFTLSTETTDTNDKKNFTLVVSDVLHTVSGTTISPAENGDLKDYFEIVSTATGQQISSATFDKTQKTIKFVLAKDAESNDYIVVKAHANGSKLCDALGNTIELVAAGTAGTRASVSGSTDVATDDLTSKAATLVLEFGGKQVKVAFDNVNIAGHATVKTTLEASEAFAKDYVVASTANTLIIKHKDVQNGKFTVKYEGTDASDLEGSLKITANTESSAGAITQVPERATVKFSGTKWE